MMINARCTQEEKEEKKKLTQTRNYGREVDTKRSAK